MKKLVYRSTCLLVAIFSTVHLVASCKTPRDNAGSQKDVLVSNSVNGSEGQLLNLTWVGSNTGTEIVVCRSNCTQAGSSVRRSDETPEAFVQRIRSACYQESTLKAAVINDSSTPHLLTRGLIDAASGEVHTVVAEEQVELNKLFDSPTNAPAQIDGCKRSFKTTKNAVVELSSKPQPASQPASNPEDWPTCYVKRSATDLEDMNVARLAKRNRPDGPLEFIGEFRCTGVFSYTSACENALQKCRDLIASGACKRCKGRCSKGDPVPPVGCAYKVNEEQ